MSRPPKHGHASGRRSRVLNSYWAMRMRCENRHHPAHAAYAGRGIAVCERWRAGGGVGFANFLQDMGEPPQGTTLDRIDNDGPYCKANCRWATPKEQGNNSRRNIFIEHAGERLTVKQWSEKLGVSYEVLRWRVKRWPADRALTTAVRPWGQI